MYGKTNESLTTTPRITSNYFDTPLDPTRPHGVNNPTPRELNDATLFLKGHTFRSPHGGYPIAQAPMYGCYGSPYGSPYGGNCYSCNSIGGGERGFRGSGMAPN